MQYYATTHEGFRINTWVTVCGCPLLLICENLLTNDGVESFFSSSGKKYFTTPSNHNACKSNHCIGYWRGIPISFIACTPLQDSLYTFTSKPKRFDNKTFGTKNERNLRSCPNCTNCGLRLTVHFITLYHSFLHFANMIFNRIHKWVNKTSLATILVQMCYCQCLNQAADCIISLNYYTGQQ